MTQLKWKRVPWKQQMLRSLEAGRDKLSEYYTQTNSAKRHIYAISTMLSPDNRFQFFLTDDWEKKWRDIYRRSFQEALLPYQERLSEINEGLNISLSPKPQSMFDRLNKPGIGGNQRQSSTGVSEMCQYLDSGMSLISEGFIFHLLTMTRCNHR
jgi:hypothetical protein